MTTRHRENVNKIIHYLRIRERQSIAVSNAITTKKFTELNVYLKRRVMRVKFVLTETESTCVAVR
jgi:hypothetical protein